MEDLGVGPVDGAPSLPPCRTAAPPQAEFVRGGGWLVLVLMLERDTATRGIFTNQGILSSQLLSKTITECLPAGSVLPRER